MYNHRRSIYDYDRIFPLRTKFVERPDMLGGEVAEEDQYNGLDPQVELIARVSYRLGHAEGNANNFAFQLEDTQSTLEKKTTELKEVRDSKNYYERKFDESDKANDELLAKVARLEKKLKPKTAKKKVVKRGRKT